MNSCSGGDRQTVYKPQLQFSLGAVKSGRLHGSNITDDANLMDLAGLLSSTSYYPILVDLVIEFTQNTTQITSWCVRPVNTYMLISQLPPCLCLECLKPAYPALFQTRRADA